MSELALAETSLTGSEGFSTSVQAAKVLSMLHYTQTELGKLSPDSDRYETAYLLSVCQLWFSGGGGLLAVF